MPPVKESDNIVIWGMINVEVLRVIHLLYIVSGENKHGNERIDLFGK